MHDRHAWQSPFYAQLAAQLCHTAELLSIKNWTLSFIKKLVQEIKGHTCIYICLRMNLCNLRTVLYFVVSLLYVWHQPSFIFFIFFFKTKILKFQLISCTVGLIMFQTVHKNKTQRTKMLSKLTTNTKQTLCPVTFKSGQVWTWCKT